MTVVFEMPDGLRVAGALADSLIKSGSAQPVAVHGSLAAEIEPSLERIYTVESEGSGGARLARALKHEGIELSFVAPSRQTYGTWQQKIRLSQAKRLRQWSCQNKVKVAVVDTGVDVDHPQLKNIKFVDHLTEEPRRPDITGHGTHVVGLIGAEPCKGNSFHGIAFDCAEITMHRGMGWPEDRAAYYRALTAAGFAQVINLSLGGAVEDALETRFIKRALARGSVVVAATGNSGVSKTHFPAGIPDVIAVGATDDDDGVATFSNTGNHVLLAAPGMDIVSTVPTYSALVGSAVGFPPLAAVTGTSMAAPIVSGVIARMLAHRPDLTRSQVIDLIRAKLCRTWDSNIGHGLVDAFALLSAL